MILLTSLRGAEATKQSRVRAPKLDCFAAARNDESKATLRAERPARIEDAPCGSAASLTVSSVQSGSALAITLRQCRWRYSHFDFVLREFVAQRHCYSQRLDKPFVRRLNVSVKLDDKELVVENMRTIVIAHGTPPGVLRTSIPGPTTGPGTLMLG